MKIQYLLKSQRPISTLFKKLNEKPQTNKPNQKDPQPIKQIKKPHHHSKLFWFSDIMAKFTASSLINKKKQTKIPLSHTVHLLKKKDPNYIV